MRELIERLRTATFGYDVFICYARSDGASYATRLAAELADRGYAPYLDVFATVGADLASAVSRVLRRTRLFVIVATPRTLQSVLVDDELRYYAQRKGGPVVVIEVGAQISDAVWFHRVAGLAYLHESPSAAETGIPSRETIAHLDHTFAFLRTSTRVRRLFVASAFTITVLSLVIVIGGLYQVRRLSQLPPPGDQPSTVAPFPPRPTVPIPTGEDNWQSLPLWAVVSVSSISGCVVTIAAMRYLKIQPVQQAKEATRIAVASGAELYSSFISYSHADKAFARRLEESLASHGIRCWRDEKQLTPGADLHRTISKAISDSDRLLLCCSRSSLKSWWVDNELGAAFQKEESDSKTLGRYVEIVIPLNLDGHLFTDDWTSGYKSRLRGRVAADFTGWKRSSRKFDEQVNRLAEALHANSPC